MCSGTRRRRTAGPNLADARNSSPRRRGRPGLAAGHPAPIVLRRAVADMPSWVWTLARCSGHRRARTTARATPLATRAELFAELAARDIDPAGQRGIHLVRHAACTGCSSAGRIRATSRHGFGAKRPPSSRSMTGRRPWRCWPGATTAPTARQGPRPGGVVGSPDHGGTARLAACR